MSAPLPAPRRAPRPATGPGWQRALQRAWQVDGAWARATSPAAALFGAVAAARRRRLEASRRAAPLPTLVVGNLVVGGSGKTPLVIAIAARARTLGLRVGIVSRGYGATPQRSPRRVRAGDDTDEVGDEPVLLAGESGAAVVVCTARADAVASLAASGEVDLVLADDGLQHYAMARDAELCVIDAARGLGNARLLPAGPLREGVERLSEVDLIALRHDVGQSEVERLERDAMPPGIAGWPVGVARGGFSVRPEALRAVGPGERGIAAGDGADAPDAATTDTLPLDWLVGRRVHAVAGIARPERLFESLRALGAEVVPHAFADHHRYRHGDIGFDDALPVVTTSKDAVKLRRLSALPADTFELRTRACLSSELQASIDALLLRLLPAADDRADERNDR